VTREVFALAMATFAESASPDELAVIALCAERIDGARGYYGRLEMRTDERDFAQEALEEAADGFTYSALALMRKKSAEVSGG
jgi:hypothetical protein